MRLFSSKFDEQYSDAYYFYKFSLQILLYGTSSINVEDCLTNNIQYLKNEHQNNYQGWDENKFLLLGNILTNLGDCVYAHLNVTHNNVTQQNKESLQKDFFNFMHNYVMSRKDKNTRRSIVDTLSDMILADNNGKHYSKNDYIRVFNYYILAYLYFKKGTSNNMANFQCYRILSTIKYNLTDTKSLNDKLNDIISFFTECSIAEKRASFKEMHFENTVDWIRIFENGRQKKENDEIFLNSSKLLYDETMETILSYLSIKLRYIHSSEKMEDFNKIINIIRFDNVNSILNRIKLIIFLLDINIKNLAFMFDIKSIGQYAKEWNILTTKISELSSSYEESDNPDNAKKLLRVYNNIQDSIVKLFEAINLIKLYGENFALTNFYVAEIYHKMSHLLTWETVLRPQWVKIKRKEEDNNKKKGKKDKKDKKENEISKWLIDDIYNTEDYKLISLTNAERYYYKAKEMHHEGRTYKDMINRSCFLNDEFSDQRFHFITAHERWNITQANFNELLKREKSQSFPDYYSIKEFTHNI